MRVMFAEQIMDLLKLPHESENYQKIYKIAALIVNDASDGDIIDQALKRELFPREKCEKCGKDKEYYFSDNGVLDSVKCSDADYFSGKHK